MKKLIIFMFLIAFLGTSFSYAQCEGYGYFNFSGSASVYADLGDGEIADGDGDGVLDLFAISYSYFVTYEITGINSFAYTSVITNSNSAVEFRNFSISDVDNDGDIDVFILYVVNQVPNYVELFLNDGTNQFSTSGQVFSIVSSSENIALDDVDGDSYVDAVFSNSVYLNDGTGQFNNSTNYIGNNVSLADFDGDGDLDAINNDSIYFNNGSGFFTANPLGFSGVSFSGFYPKIVDIDGDGDVDVFRKDTIFINDGTGNFNSSISFPFLYTSTMYDVEFADIDGDGDVDVASSGDNAINGGSGELNIFINDGLGNFISRPFDFTSPFPGSPQFDIELADLNNDGYPDIVGFQGYLETNIFENDRYSYQSLDFQVSASSFSSLTLPPFVVEFDNLSYDPMNYNFTWDFGDDSTLQSNNSTVTHEYQYNGLYDVMLIAENILTGCLDTMLKIDLIDCSGGPNLSIIDVSNQINIFPNPTNENITISIDNFNGNIQTEVYDLIGNKLQTTSETTISLQEYARGIYILKVAYGNRIEELKVIKE